MAPSGGLNRAIGDLAFADRICVTSILEQVDARRRLSLLFSQQVDRVRPTERRLRGGRGKRNGRKANREGLLFYAMLPSKSPLATNAPTLRAGNPGSGWGDS